MAKHTGWAAVAVILAGCGELFQSDPLPSREGPVVPTTERERDFADIPVPRNFSREPHSFAHERGSFRICRLAYTGPLDTYRTVEFMKEQMGILGWKLLDSSLDDDEKVLRYAKRADRCSVSVRREPSERRTRLAVSIDPAGPEGPTQPD